MELAMGAMAGLAPKLGDLLMAEYVVQKGLKPDIESLSMEFLMMKASLEDSSRVPPDQLSEVDKLWARQVRELSYDIEDVVDDFIQRVAGGESAAPAIDANIFKKILHKATAMMKKVKDRHQIFDKVKDIKKLSNNLAELRAKYTVRGAGANLAASTGIDPRVLNLYKKESDLVGIEESRDRVIRMLSVGTKDDAHTPVSNKSLKIVSIAGVGGLGKTTLAKTVYDMLKKQFGCCAFISVGRTPNLAWTFKKMLVELDQKYKQVDMAGWDVERFCNELQQFLEQKRYFMVVDDIWDKGSWEAIKYALKDNNCGSRIIMTTRNSEVITKEEELHRLKHLSDGNSTKLFYKRIQRWEGESLDAISGELPSPIISKCGGIPLAIIAAASLLVDRPREDWSKVFDSIGFGNGDNTAKILSYSYYDLPSYLKPCLLYLSIYPEDFIHDTKCIIWRWIAEDFVHRETQEVGSLFEVGERYFNELVNRSMIQPRDDKYGRFIQKFTIHDIVFDQIRKLSTAENFTTILDGKEQQASMDSLRSQKKTSMLRLDSKVRQLTLHNYHVQHIPEYIIDMPEVLRSLNIVHCKIKTMVRLHCFRVCRVLYIKYSYVPSGLKHVGMLLYVKYLEISDAHVCELPREIGHLKSLQTLLLYNTGLDELPPTVCSLTQLMCLLGVGFKRFPADRIGYLTSLEELRLKSVDGRSDMDNLVVELGKLTRLRVVTIRFTVELEESQQESLVKSLCNLHELKELKLSYRGLSQQLGASVWEDCEVPSQLRRLHIDDIILSRWPRWINRSCLPRLCYLSLKVAFVEVQDLDNLARLPELSYLMLVGSSYPPGYTVGTDGFRNLRFCCVSTTLKFHMGAMPELEELQFRVYAGHFCWEKNDVALEQSPTKEVIEDLDLGLDNLHSIEQVTVTVDCSGATTAEVQEVEGMVMRAVENHPNRPTIKMDRKYEGDIISGKRREALLQHFIEKYFSVLEWKDKSDAFFIAHMRWYRLLQKAVIFIDCAGASMCEVEKVEAACRNAAKLHHNHPTIQLTRMNIDKMVSLSDHPDTEVMSLIVECFQGFLANKMGNLKELRLKSVVGRSATEDLVVELGKQTMLRVVTITFCEELEESLQKALVQSLCNLQELRELELSFTGSSQQRATAWEEDWEAPRQLWRLLISRITFSRLPGWINNSDLPLLCVLSLSVDVVEVHDLDNLGRLPELSNLELDGSSWPPGYTVGMDRFRNLRICCVGTSLKFHVGAMPRLEELQFKVYAGHWSWEANGMPLEQLPTKEVIEDLDLGLDNLLALEKVTVTVDCSGATAAEVQEVEAVATRAVENHPNRPTIQMDRVCEKNILSKEKQVERLQHDIEKEFNVLDWKDEPDAGFISYLRRYRCLEEAVIFINCSGASKCEVTKVGAAFRHAAVVHPNHPTIHLFRTRTYKMVSSSNHPDTQLTCLIAEGFQRFPTDNMGNLVSLEKLQLKNVVGRSATEDLVVELGKQKRLRVITIAFSEELEESLQKALVQSLSNLQELQELELSFTGLSQQGVAMWVEDWEAPRQLQSLVIEGITFSRLPRWINHCHLLLLCDLSLSVYVVKVHDLDNLGRLPELRNLELVGFSWPPGYIVGTHGFRNLRICCVGTTLKFLVGAMPRLEELQFEVFAGHWSWEKHGIPLEVFPTNELVEDLDMGLDNLLALEEVTVRVDCSGATATEVQEVEAMVTRAVENHPNCPTIQMDRVYEKYILSEEKRVERLQNDIEENFDVLKWKDKPEAGFISYLRKYRRLQKAIISIDCVCASMCEVDKVEAGFRHAAEVHPNHPAIQLLRTNTDKMVSSSDHPETEETEQGDDHDDSPDNLLCKLQLRN